MSKTTNTIEMKTIKMLILTELLTEHTGKQHLRQFQILRQKLQNTRLEFSLLSDRMNPTKTHSPTLSNN
jgi:hypothetical protein